MPTFGLITEGPTDQVVIKHILFGIFNDPDLAITRLQPKADEPGNWAKVFDYCCSKELKQALYDIDFLIIQIDTDVLIREQLPEKYRLDLPSHLSVEATVERVSKLLISLMDDGEQFWENYGGRILFGISVHQLECWLLPIYFKDKLVKAAKITGCIDTLNEVLQQKEGFFIHGKDLSFYSKMSKHFRKNVLQIYHLNPSLKIFVERVLKVKVTV